MDLSDQTKIGADSVSRSAFPRFADLYCGAGFGARGVVSAGGTPLIAVDAWGRAVEAYRRNFPNARVFHNLVEELDPFALAKEYKIDLLLTSPECTSHSIARGARPACDRSRETALHILPWIKAFLPRWVIVENVGRMTRWERHSEFVDSIRDVGYQIQPIIINASDVGAPQSRKRLFLLCDRETFPPTQEQILAIQAPKHIAQDILDPPETWPDTPLFSPRRAQRTLERANRAIAALGEGVPFLIVYYGTDRSGGWQSLTVPLRTVTTLDRFGLVTWKNGEARMRMLQPSELVRAMAGVKTQHVIDVGSRRDRVKLCGNGICSPVLERLVQALCIGDSKLPGIRSRQEAEPRRGGCETGAHPLQADHAVTLANSLP